MEKNDIRHLPVTNAGKLDGIVSDRDIKLALDPLVNFPPQRKVRDIMTSDIYVVPPSEPLDVVLQALADRRIGCALVADDGALLGIFTTTDAARMLGELLQRSAGEGRT
jgi:acetoin utilization protein AcuB